jgi:hypothetical protein
MLLLKHNGTVYGRVNGGSFEPTEALQRLDPSVPDVRSLWVLGQLAADFYAKRGFTIIEAHVPRLAAPNN